MIDRDKIPDPTYYELIELFGTEKAEEYIEMANYNYRTLEQRILMERLKRRYMRSILHVLILRFKNSIIRNKAFIVYTSILAAILVTVYLILS